MASIDIKAKGITAAEFVTKVLPDAAVLPSIGPALERLKDLGVTVMTLSILETTGEKSTGELARSIQGFVEPLSPESWSVEIGSDVPHAFYASQEIRWSRIDHAVKIRPMGRWRFIGARPPMPSHPFLEETEYALKKAIPEEVGEEFEANFELIRKQVDELQRQEEE